jgi:GntR family transcriptional repressor for pyruvate dehydrogenase complex
LQHVFIEHSAVFDAIERGDGDEARALMKAHLIGSRNRLFFSQSE